jgi:glyoxylate reductase
MSAGLKKMSVWVTHRIPEKGIEMLRKQFGRVTVGTKDGVLSEEALIRGVRGRDGVVCLLSDPMTARVMDAEPRLRVIAAYAAGTDNIDVAHATARGIPVTNTPGALTESTAELAWALLMAAARRIVESDEYTRAGKFRGWGPLLLLGRELNGKTLGIIGAGRIGGSVARKARAFDMNVIYFEETRKPELERETGARLVALDELLRKSDFISLHVPLTPKTRGLIGAKQFAMMKPEAILVNTARGKALDEEALVKALKNGTIAAAGLDVYAAEPEIHPGLMGLRNVVLLPHIGSATVEARTSMAVTAAENLIAALKGRRPANLVNKEAWK